MSNGHCSGNVSRLTSCQYKVLKLWSLADERDVEEEASVAEVEGKIRAQISRQQSVSGDAKLDCKPGGTHEMFGETQSPRKRGEKTAPELERGVPRLVMRALYQTVT